MKKRLYLKFIAAYMILAVVELLVITSLGQQLVFDALVKNRAEGLYAEAGKASSLRVRGYFSGDKSAESTYASLSMAASVTGGTIRVIGTDGSLTGYAGGMQRKEALLVLEQAAGSQK